MYDAILAISIGVVVATAVWAIVVCMRLIPPTDAYPGSVTVIRLLSVPFLLSILLYVLPSAVGYLFSGNAGGNIEFNSTSFKWAFLQALWFVTIFIVFFAFVLRTTVRNRTKIMVFPVRMKPLSHSTFIFFWILFFTISLALIFTFASRFGGLLPLILKGYRVTELFSGNAQYVAAFAWLNTLSLLLLVHMRMRKSFRGQVVAFTLIAFELLAYLLMGRRSTLVGLGIAILVVYHLHYRKLGLKAVIAICFIGFIILNVLGLIRGDSYESLTGAYQNIVFKGADITNTGRMDPFYTLTKGNFVQPFQTLPNIISSDRDDIEFEWGMGLLKSVSLLVPRELWADRPEPLSNWYMRKFIDVNAKDNEGMQFFFLSDAYLNFGVLGAPIWGLIYGIFFGSIAIMIIRRLQNEIYVTLFAVTVGNILNFIASDTVGSVVVFVKIYALPCILFIILLEVGNINNFYDKFRNNK